MKTARMIIGIISMVLFIIITFQSCAAGLGNAMQSNGETSGSAGFFLALCMLVGGIIGVAARRSKGGSITAGCFYAIGGIIGIANVGSYKDLMVWSVIAFIFAVVFLVGAFFGKEDVPVENDNTNE